MHPGSLLAWIAVSAGCATLIARLAVDPLRGRPHHRCRGYLLLVAAVTALPESLLPPGIAPLPAVAGVALTANLLILAALLVAELVSGRLLAQAGLDHLLAVVCAAVMTLATAGAIVIESTDPPGAPFGHVLSLGLLVACVMHLRWAAMLAPVERSHNPRAPLGAATAIGLVATGLVASGAVVACASALGGASGDPWVVLVVGALAASPELAVLVHAVRRDRADVACAVVLGGVILNLASVAVADLAGLRAAPYRLEAAGALLVVAGVTTAILAVLGARLFRVDALLTEH